MSLSALIPIIGGVAAVVAPFAAVWLTLRHNEQEAIETHNAFVENLKALPGVLRDIDNAAKSGLISGDLQKHLLFQLGLGSEKLPSDFKITLPPLDPNHLFPIANAQPGRMHSLPGMPQAGDLKEVNEQLEKAGYLISKIEKDGTKTFEPSDKGLALVKLVELRQKFSQETVSGYEKERLVAKQAYEESRDNLEDLIRRAGRGLEAAGIDPQKLRDQLKAGFDAKNAEIDFKQRNEDQQKADAAFTAGQAQFAKMVSEENAGLERQLALDAAKAGKSREEMYQHEFDKRMFLLEQQLYSGEIDEKEYTDAVQEATTKRIEATNRETEAQRRLAEIKAKVLGLDQKQPTRNPLLGAVGGQAENNQAQLSDINKQIADAQAALQKNTEQSFQPLDTQQQTQLAEKRIEIEKDLNRLLEEQGRIQEKIDQERVQGVETMFKNMGAAAKAYGREGVAVYKAMSIAQATIDTAKAAIAAYSSVAGIPYVGWILAPIAAAAAVAAGVAQISQIESAGGGFRAGGFTGSGSPDEVAGVVHRGEFVIPAERVRGNLPWLEAFRNGRLEVGSPPISSGEGGDGHTGGGQVVKNEHHFSFAVVDGKAEAQRWAESEEGKVWFISMLDRNISQYQRT